jgi:hypothetical protein
MRVGFLREEQQHIILIYDILRGLLKTKQLHNILVIYCLSVENEAIIYYIIAIMIVVS